MTDLLVDSAVQEALADNQVAADSYDALNATVAEQLKEAARRAEANDRLTVMSQDL